MTSDEGHENTADTSPAPPQRQMTLPPLPTPTLTRLAWFGGLAVAGVVGVLE